MSNSQIGEKVGLRSNEVSSINHGKLYGHLRDEYPIRNIAYPKDYDEKQLLAHKVIRYIEEYMPVTQIELQKVFGKGRVVIENIIKGKFPYNIDEYKYPLKLK